MVAQNENGKLVPKLISFDVLGTLVDVSGGAQAAFRSILDDSGGAGVDVAAFWDHWVERNVAHYREPYRSYKEICELSLAETFEHLGLKGSSRLIERYFEVFPKLSLFAEASAGLDFLAMQYRTAIVSDIDDDLLAAIPFARSFDLVCTSEQAKGYKPDGTLFRYLIDRAGCPRSDILHCGQLQHTDLAGAKSQDLAVAWINRRGMSLAEGVPPPDFSLADTADVLKLVA